MSAEIVWFKRDLRVHDHRPLAEAAVSGRKLVCLYVIEPQLWALPEYSGRQYAFLRETLESLDEALKKRGTRLTVRVGEVVDVLDALHRTEPVSALRAHEETGLAFTFERDKAVARWAKANDIAFIEHPQHGVIRGLKSRNGWAKRWDAFMAESAAPAPAQIACAGISGDAIPHADALGLALDPCPGRQPGGREAAVADLRSFLTTRGAPYRRAMSSPLTAFDACSRLSAHLALGSLSMREAHQAACRALADKRTAGETAYAQSIDSFISRLHWHCHFIQKFEDAPFMEASDLHPAYRGARPDPDAAGLEAWIEGRTGLPFLDACMRALAHTGWLNFRMRAMVASVSSYHFWTHWKQPAEALAARFTDFEPGIHYPQMQMQSGVTGVNTPRIYNPVKQGHDQDPSGVFIRRWIPELKALPDSFIHEPWRAPQTVLDSAGVSLGEAYPHRLVDHELGARQARARIGAIRKGEDHKAVADAIQKKHGSRKSGLKATGSATSRRKAKAADPGQIRFDF
jgi:deoxyribodipyrimidine photo-lyase